MFTLDLYRDGAVYKTVEIDPAHRTHLTFGRSPNCDYQLGDGAKNLVISRVQATLELRGEQWWVIDGDVGQPSENGVWKDAARISGEVAISVGDRIWLYRQNGSRAELRLDAPNCGLDETSCNDVITRIGYQLETLSALVAAGAESVAKVNSALSALATEQQGLKEAQRAIDLQQNARLDAQATESRRHRRQWLILAGIFGVIALVGGQKELSQQNRDKIQDALVERGIEVATEILAVGGAGYAILRAQKEPQP
jgi:hypothetical protein